MSAILVTGGTGVIGSWVTRDLVEQGHKVVTYSRHLDPMLVKDILGKFEHVSADVVDLASLIGAIKKYRVDRIIHLSAMLSANSEANPAAGYRVNVQGTLNVLEAARLMDIKRVVCTSSKGVYGLIAGEYGHPTYKPVDEDHPMAPNQVYGTCKVFMENACNDYRRIYGLDSVVLRFATPYGIGRLARHGIIALSSRIIESAMLGAELHIPQGAEQKDDFTYVRDIASSICLACFADKLEHRLYNIGSGTADSLARLIEIMKGIFGKTLPITIGPGLNYYGEKYRLRYCVFNIERARRELGYAPRYDLEAGARDYIETMRRFDIKPQAGT